MFAKKVASGDIIGGFRLLVCEQTGYEPTQIPLPKHLFEDLEDQFQLSEATLPIFENSGSLHTWRFQETSMPDQENRRTFSKTKFNHHRCSAYTNMSRTGHESSTKRPHR